MDCEHKSHCTAAMANILDLMNKSLFQIFDLHSKPFYSIKEKVAANQSQ